MRIRNYLPGLSDILGLLIVAAIASAGHSLAGDPGVGWHLKAGELIASGAAGGEGLFYDPFLFSSDNTTWVNNQWLGDWLLYKVFNAGGWKALSVMVVYLASFVYLILIGKMLRDRCFSPFCIFLVLFLCAFLGAVQWFVRPVIFSFLFFGLVYAYIYSFYEKVPSPKLINSLIVAFIFFLWANIHPAFILGLALVVLAGLSRGLELVLGLREGGRGEFLFWPILFFSCLLATFGTPFGISLWRNIFGLAGNNFFMNLNNEWLSPDFYQPTFIFFLLSLSLIIFLVCQNFKQKLLIFDWALIIVFAFAALLQRRYIPFFGIALALPLAKLFQAYWSNWRSQEASIPRAFLALEMREVGKTTILYTLLSLILLFSFQENIYSAVGPEKHFPSRSIDYLAKSSSKGKIFHTPDWGGYLTLKLWPEKKAWIDDRNQLNGQAQYQLFLDLNNVSLGWEASLMKSKFTWLLLEKGSGLEKIMRENKVLKRLGYKKVIEEKVAVLLERDSLS